MRQLRRSSALRCGLLVATALLGTIAVGVGPATAGLLVHRNHDGVVSINPLLCLTDYQIRQAIASAGFTHVSLNAPIETHIQARGTKGGIVYLIDFNYCAGYIVSAQPLRSAK